MDVLMDKYTEPRLPLSRSEERPLVFGFVICTLLYFVVCFVQCGGKIPDVK